MDVGKRKRLNLLARVHIAKKDLAMAEVAYREMLDGEFGVNSAGKLTLGQLYRLIEIFCEKGWKPSRRGKRPAMPAGSAIPRVGCSEPQWRHIRWLQKELRWNDTNLRGYFRHVAGVDHERFLAVATAREVITGMRQTLKWQQEHPGAASNKHGAGGYR